MLIFASSVHRRHAPPHEVLDGRQVPFFEQPARAEAILAELAARGFAQPQDAAPAPRAALAAVHRSDYLDYLDTAAEQWTAAGLHLPVLPSSWAAAAHAGRSRAPGGRAGQYIGDLSAPIDAGTREAAYQSAGLALAGAEAVRAGAPAAYALCRPPGHHAGPARAAGYCYLNNAAVAAAALSRQRAESWALHAPTVAILDLDYHHGDGTQAIFAERSDVLVVSLHADPAEEYPYFSGYADETGSGAGSGYHYNLPLPHGCGNAPYLTALDQALDVIAGFAPRYLLVSLGVDTAEGDPLGGFQLTRELYPTLGRRIAGLGLPTLLLQEGGYQVPLIGALVADVLEGFTHAREAAHG